MPIRYEATSPYHSGVWIVTDQLTEDTWGPFDTLAEAQEKIKDLEVNGVHLDSGE